MDIGHENPLPFKTQVLQDQQDKKELSYETQSKDFRNPSLPCDDQFKSKIGAKEKSI